MSDLPSCHKVLKAGRWTGEAADRVTLDYAGRLLRRRRLRTEGGRELLVDLAETVSLEAGDALVLADGRLVEVVAAIEDLVAVTGPGLVRAAWHIGNRHTPCQIEEGRLVIARDHVIEAMLRQLGVTLTEVRAPFAPEGGAYGHGRTLGHDHGPDGGHGHDPAQGGHHGRGVHFHVSHRHDDAEDEGPADET